MLADHSVGLEVAVPWFIGLSKLRKHGKMSCCLIKHEVRALCNESTICQADGHEDECAFMSIGTMGKGQEYQ